MPELRTLGDCAPRCIASGCSAPRGGLSDQGFAAPARTAFDVGGMPRDGTAGVTAPSPAVCDVLVAGSGIAGMSAAIDAAEAGVRVVVVEKDSALGGNSRWAAGYDLEAGDFDAMRRQNPDGDPTLQRVLVDSFDGSLNWLRSHGVELTEARPDRFEYRRGQGPGGIEAFAALRDALYRAGGELRLGVALTRLLADSNGEVVGACVRGSAGSDEIRGHAVVLATGGFGNSIDLKARYLGPAGSHTRTYGSDRHDGDGLLAALEVGAAVSSGITVPTGGLVFPPPFEPPVDLHHLEVVDRATSEPVPRNVQALMLRPPAAWCEEPAVLVNLRGERYVDESVRYTLNGWKTTCQPHGAGFCIFDSTVYERHAAAHELARAYGAVIYREDSLAALAERLRDWRATDSYHDGVDPHRFLATISSYNDAVRVGRGNELHPRRANIAAPIDAAPYYAAPVVQAVVDTAGCLRIDATARVLDRSGRPIPGLFAAGADGGRAYDIEHGGLSAALIFGRAAGREAARRAVALGCGRQIS